MTLVFSVVFPRFLIFKKKIMNMQIRQFSFRSMTSINLSYDITGLLTKCHNDCLGVKLVYLWIFNDFSVSFNVFIKIHEYAN